MPLILKKKCEKTPKMKAKTDGKEGHRLKAPPHNSRLGAQAACRAKIFRDIFQKCSPIRQGLPALFGSSHKKFFGTLHHLKLCGVASKNSQFAAEGRNPLPPPLIFLSLSHIIEKKIQQGGLWPALLARRSFSAGEGGTEDE